MPATVPPAHEAGTNNYTATRFGYAMNDRTLTHAVGESWTWDGNPESCPANYSIAWAREFRYDGARARYLNRRLDPVALMAGNFVSLEDVWTDYDGDSAYGDYSVTPGTPATVTNLRSYQPGMAVGEWGQNNALPTASSTDYSVTDHLGTTRGMTLPNGFPEEGATFTAFGEKVTGADHRYGYVGSHGYQAHEEMSYLHLGARYYDSATGRFLQRDPIGIGGGMNVYVYGNNCPTALIDPAGEFSVRGAIGGIIGGVVGGLSSGAVLGPGAIVGGLVGGVIGGIVGGLTTETIGGGLIAGGLSGAIGGSLSWMQIGYRAGTFAYNTGGGWLIGNPHTGIITGVMYHAPWLRIPFPIPFPGSVPGMGCPAGANCFFTMLRAMACGWGL